MLRPRGSEIRFFMLDISGNPETTDLSRAALSSGISVTERYHIIHKSSSQHRSINLICSQELNSVRSRRIPSGFSPVPAVPGSAPASSASLVSTPAPVIVREEPKVAPTKFIRDHSLQHSALYLQKAIWIHHTADLSWTRAFYSMA